MCDHANVEVTCQSQFIEGTPAFVLNLKATCRDCGVPFEFAGFPADAEHLKPSVSTDFRILSLPMMPTQLLGAQFHRLGSAADLISSISAEPIGEPLSVLSAHTDVGQRPDENAQNP